jgi:hypothetical protein
MKMEITEKWLMERNACQAGRLARVTVRKFRTVTPPETAQKTNKKPDNGQGRKKCLKVKRNGMLTSPICKM